VKLNIALILFLAVIPSAHSQSLEQQDLLSHAQKALDLLNQMQAISDEQAHATKYSCLKAFGNETFCGCISENLPMVFSFSDYITIVTKSKVENGYAQLNADSRKAYDTVPAVREKCVGLARSVP
jgi:hypothetical protein